MIKNIILDMGKVVNTFDIDDMLTPYCDSEEEKKIVGGALFYTKEWLLADEGILDEAGLLSAMLSKLPAEYHKKAKLVFDNWDNYMRENDGVRDFIMSQKQKGRKIYLLSNASIRLVDYFETKSIFRLFDGYVCSAAEKVLKPDERIYRILLERFNLNAGECFFVDDLEENIEAAKKLGFFGQVFKGSFDDIIV